MDNVSEDGDYLESFHHYTKNAEESDSDNSNDNVVEVVEHPPTRRASLNGRAAKKRAVETEVSDLVLLQPPPPYRKLRD